MADICKCTGVKDIAICPLRDACHRYTVPDGFRQSYFTNSPFVFKMTGINLSGVDCGYYWPTERGLVQEVRGKAVDKEAPKTS